jgi:serine protease AprX
MRGISNLAICFFVVILYNNNVDVFSQQSARFWVQFTDKGANVNLLNFPEKVLSERSISRRLKNNSPFIEADLPVWQKYVDSITVLGATPLYTSKWFNSATIILNNLSDTNKIKACSFVNKIEQTSDVISNKSLIIHDKNTIQLTNNNLTIIDPYYGYAYSQIVLEKGTSLHEKGFKGNGIHIAIIDAGFLNADLYASLENARSENRILGQKDFVSPENNVFNSDMHGAAVLSIIGANLPGTFVGTAPEASYWLLRSEDAITEYPVEEDNWVAAAEFADSVGADILNTSLGYTQFDNPKYNHSYSTLNGVSTRMSLAASMAVTKGMVVVNSAGNDGNKSWHYIGIPADALGILSVGATDLNGKKATFSSFGPSADGRIKPEVSAMGVSNLYESSPNKFVTGNGTSFSGPVITGLTACLMQAFPNVMATDIIEVVKKSASNYSNPYDSLGYGIPDFEKAYNILYDSFVNVTYSNSSNVKAYPNPFTTSFHLALKNCKAGLVNVECYTISGQKVFKVQKDYKLYLELSSEIQSLPEGIYLFKLMNNDASWFVKALKKTDNR